ncbi:MAG: phosphatase PAP2 family protein [Rickettsiales bacterium]|jgi:membrane-associated phospholipid phosphatase|nr:phosphatase PAP2 family protein [Rickettsiales bacterium]
MFLTKHEHINPRAVFRGTIILTILLILGFAGADGFLFDLTRPFSDWKIWAWTDSVGQWKYIAAAALLAFIAAKIYRFATTNKLGLEKLSANIFCAVVLAEGLVGAIKLAVGRLRPPFHAFDPFSMSDIAHSFPSGHTAGAFAALVSIGLLYPRLKPVSWTIAAIAGIGRVCYGAHWPTDVLAGAFIGALSADIIVYVRHRHRYQVSGNRYQEVCICCKALSYNLHCTPDTCFQIPDT